MTLAVVNASPLIILGKGETDVIAHGIKHQNVVCILDDRQARKVAKLRGLKVIGCLGLLVKAYREKRLSDPYSAVKTLKLAGFRCNEKIISEAIRML